MANSQIILYEASDGLQVRVKLEDETVWLTQEQMAQLFNKAKSTINEHIKNIYAENELEESQTMHKFRNSEFQQKAPIYYNLDVIISVGYRVKSQQGTQFRIWATKRLKEYIVKGFTLDDERLKEGKRNAYFDELIERVRDIRTSERNFYQKITDIYATSIDYNSKSNLTQDFFATVQNKMHFGIHGHTAAEVISMRADAKKPNMGITCMSERKIQRKDVFVAKNYLTKDELQELNLIVDQYLSFAELQARNNKAMRMEDWIRKLDDFLRLNEKEILLNKGSISKKLADKKAEKEFLKFKKDEDKKFVSDFDKSVKKILKNNL
ncbi:MAG: virulence RhuM family protein [Candidatus Aenigmarchaeota archaeon]|nr:virulence RhuM family protein [Candidatus Aenigmarchaeota archaeon]